jgi:hypothetical protein
METGFAFVVQLAAGLCLAACCGLRAFLPPLMLGLAARLGIPELLLGRSVLSPSFEWLASTPALAVFAAALVFEVLADKFPALDHLLDLVQTIVRPAAGALVVAAAMGFDSPVTSGIVGLIAGSPLAAAVHVGKAKIRLLSTAGTGGLGSPVLSILEDAATFLGSAVALVFAFAAVVIIVTGAAVTWRVVRVFLRRVGRLRDDLGQP